jgi:hypothetical protein
VPKPELSVIVIAYNMARELPRTLYSLTSGYQQNVDPADYEVLVVDNGSQPPVREEEVSRFGPNFRLARMQPPQASPAAAINYGAGLLSGKYLGVLIDGARIVSPGVLHYALRGLRSFENPVVCTLGLHLGQEHQRIAITKGYTQAVEDELLRQIDWRNQGYRLFDISTPAGSVYGGWFMPVRESNCFFMPMDSFRQLGGYEPRFDLPGGGLVNHDFLVRARQQPGSSLVVLLGEGSFHQVHGGAATNTNGANWPAVMEGYKRQYMEIRRRPFEVPAVKQHYLGHLPEAFVKFLVFSATNRHFLQTHNIKLG